MRIGYARVSSRDQHTDTQEARLAACCDKVLVETASGMKRDRPRLQDILDRLWKNDVLVVCKLDRLARSTAHLYSVAETLQQREATLEILDQHLDTATLTGKMLFGFLALMAEFEHGLRKERQREGILAAQAKGVHFGRTKRLTPEQIQTLRHARHAGTGVAELARRYQLTRTSIYRYLTDKDTTLTASP